MKSVNGKTKQLVASALRAKCGFTCSAGFDGYVDRIARVVHTRLSQEEYRPYRTIAEFSKAIASAAGCNADMELVTQETRMGGNAVLMSGALAALGVRVLLMAAMGVPEHPAFSAMPPLRERVSLGACAECLALEFDDGKIMLGDSSALQSVSAETLLRGSDLRAHLKRFCGAELIALVNWAQMGDVLSLWELVLEKAGETPGRRIAFFDLADFSKRTPAEVEALMRLITKRRPTLSAILGLNLNEARLLARHAGLLCGPSPAALCAALHERYKIEIVIHNRMGSACVSAEGNITELATEPLKHPRTLTGAGDHFNAGYCFGRLSRLDCEGALYAAVALSRRYVETGRCPSAQELSEYITDME